MKKVLYWIEIGYKAFLIIVLCYVGNAGYILFDWCEKALYKISKEVSKP
jgi:hypothetical protein